MSENELPLSSSSELIADYVASMSDELSIICEKGGLTDTAEVLKKASKMARQIEANQKSSFDDETSGLEADNAEDFELDQGGKHKAAG